MKFGTKKLTSGKAQQAGFTIVELVVVIIILGILAAAAVPRFLDVADDAYLSQVESLRSSMVAATAQTTGLWNAQGRPSIRIVEANGDGVVSAADAFLNLKGFIVDESADATTQAQAATDCKELYDVLMGPSSTPVNTAAVGTTGANAITAAKAAWTAADPKVDWFAVADTATPTYCNYVFLPEGITGGGYSAYFTYTFSDGSYSTITTADLQ